MELSPKIAAELADEVYGVQDEIDLKLFLAKSIFSRSSLQSQSFKAEVGTRLINFQDGFGVGARGASEYEKDLFLMFRGSTMANYGADWFSNGRCGVQVTAAGPVHIGFLQIFNSMRGELEGFVSRLIGDAQNPVHTIHCIGHSLGGAIATLTAGWAK